MAGVRRDDDGLQPVPEHHFDRRLPALGDLQLAIMRALWASDEATVVEKGALGPGQILAVDMAEGRLFHDAEIKDKLAAGQPFSEWVGKINDAGIEAVVA